MMSDELILWICHHNRNNPPIEITKRVVFLGFKFVFNWRSPKNLWGRFGGGWKWKLGIQAGGSTVIFDIFVFSIRVDKIARQDTKESAPQPTTAAACHGGE